MAQLLNNLLASLSPSDGIEVNDPVFLRFQEFAMRAESTETSGRAVAWFCGVSEPKVTASSIIIIICAVSCKNKFSF